MPDLGECAGCPVLGDCCHLNVEVGGQMFQSSVACPFLGADRLCTRYETRDKVPWCTMDPDRVTMPAQCAPYHDPARVVAVPHDAPAQQAVDDLARASLLAKYGVLIRPDGRVDLSEARRRLTV